MSRPLHRRRQTIASLILGAWLFGLFVGIAHACGLDGGMAMPGSLVAAHAAGDPAADRVPPGCEKFCNDDLPLVAKIQSLQDPPDGQPLILGIAHDAGRLASAPARALGPSLPARRSSGVPLSLRFVRLTL